MRKTFTCCFILFSYLSIAQIHPASKVFNYPSSPASFSTLLVVVDGVLLDADKLSNIDPNSIESVNVLKKSTTSVIFCSQVPRDVILITTKKWRKFQVSDGLDGYGVPWATVYFVAAKKTADTITMIADDSGYIITDRLERGEDYSVTISSVGYKPFSTSFKNDWSSSSRFSLEKDVVTFDPVVITTGPGCTIRRIVSCRLVTVSRCILIPAGKETEKNEQIIAKLFPNPAFRGQELKIEVNNVQAKKIKMRLMTVTGNEMLTRFQSAQKGVNRFAIPVDTRWASGIYFLQVTDESNGLLTQEKIMIH